MTQPTPTVAHEGNPDTNELTVTGTLDGEAALKFAFDVPRPEREAPNAG